MSDIRVLIAEDETHLGAVLQQFMTARGFRVTIVRNGRAALDQLQRDAYDVALLDIVMPELDGLEVLRQARERPLPAEIIMITGNGTIETAMAALKLGAYDVLSKPYRMAEIDALARRAWEKRMLARSNVVLQSRLRRTAHDPAFLTQYSPLRAVVSLLERVAPDRSPMLIEGERGTGKRAVARLAHRAAAPDERPFVEIDCRGVTEEGFAAELLGVSGDAHSQRDGSNLGALELAAGGSVYLAEVDALPSGAQDLLEGVLDAATFAPVGDAAPRALDARIIASGCGTLPTLSAALRRRLTPVHVTLPPLRERAVDLSLLAYHFASGSSSGPSFALSNDALDSLERYDWPGNVRELRLVIERATMVARHGMITSADLSPSLAEWPAHQAFTVGAPSTSSSSSMSSFLPIQSGASDRSSTDDDASETLAELERRHIRGTLERLRWHQGRAAAALGISPKTLYRKMREYGFHRPSGRAS